MHYTKYKSQQVFALLKHSDRGLDTPDTAIHSNENIDSSRTHLNYDLKDRNGKTAYQYYKEKIDNIAAETKQRTGKGLRKDAVTMCSWVLTYPSDSPPEQQEAFFKAAYDWYCTRYGADNIITAAVHMDETTPHLHLQFIPFVDDCRKLCAKEIETRDTLRNAHKELQKHLQQATGNKYNLINGATVGGNKSVLELKVDEVKEQLKDLQEEKAAADERLSKTLSKTARAAEVKHKNLNPFAKEVTYKKSMLEETRNIGEEVRADLRKTEQNLADIKRKEQRLQDMQASIEPMYRKVKQEQEQVKQLRADMEQEVQRRAEALSDKAIKEMFGKDAYSSRSQRLEEFCAEVKYKDGSSVLDKFEEEEQLRRQKNKGRSR